MAFGSKGRIEELEKENANLKQWVEYLKGAEAIQLAEQVQQYHSQLAGVEHQVLQARAQLAVTQNELGEVRSQIIVTEEQALLQEVGIYEYRHPLDDAVAYKSKLADTKNALKTMVRNNQAVQAAAGWTVNNSAQQGAKLVSDISKLMLRAYNAEADNLVRTLRPHNLASAIARLSKARDTIARLGATMDIRVTDAYHKRRVYELELTADYLTKVEEEKQRLREERERQREEEKARREFEAEKSRLTKEQSHYQSALEKLQARGDEAGAAEMNAKLEEIAAAIKGVEEREANIRAGYVYVISNFGSFGEHVVKIGLTRRLEPMDRVQELGDASVPFTFDVHALIFSHDAVGLEGNLHQAFVDRRVNLVNQRREFFYATPAEVREALEIIGGQQLLEFHEVPEASDWRASGGSHRLEELIGQSGPPAAAVAAASAETAAPLATTRETAAPAPQAP
jgi:Domain of unknown function (DUF4041)/T5orf172 domain